MNTLPAIVALTGDWGTYLDSIYEIYLDEVIRNSLTFKGKLVRARHNPATQGKGFAFWHVISTGSNEEDRLPDLRRCERIRWIKWIIKKADQGTDGILIWTNERTLRRGTAVRTLIFCEAVDYLVILEERANTFMLVSAYPVFARNKLKLKKEWQESQK